MLAEHVRVSVPELRRVLPDALRVHGIPLGQADAVAEMVIWTAATSPGAFAFLRRRRTRLLWTPRPRAVITKRHPGAIQIDARGASLLELGQPIFDAVVAEAVTVGPTEARIHRTYGDLFLPYLAWRAAGQTVEVTVRKTTGDEADGGAAAFEEDALVLSAVATDEPVITPPAAYLDAVRDGLLLEPQDFEFINAQFEMLRVPTSERSRSHAG
ncbi:MAG TPA: hypothetical protein VGG41_15440 [Solirubrobacteraceae bacterium]|jgi:hypothetical protein